jgi:hypothetical protein
MRRSGFIMQFKSFVASFFAVVLAVNMAGCQTTGAGNAASAMEQKPADANQIVRVRAQQRWDELLKSNMGGAYEFMSPGGRSIISRQIFIGRVNAAFWRGAKVEKVNCGAETCDVTVSVEIIVQGVKAAIPVQETWILESGQWWFVFQG